MGTATEDDPCLGYEADSWICAKRAPCIYSSNYQTQAYQTSRYLTPVC